MFRTVLSVLVVSCTLLGCGSEQQTSISGNSAARHLLLSCQAGGVYRAMVRLVQDDWKYFPGYDRRHEDTFALVYKFPQNLDSSDRIQSRRESSNIELEMVLGNKFQDLQLLNLTLLHSDCKAQITETAFKFKCDNSESYRTLIIMRADQSAVYSHRTRGIAEEESSHSMHCKAIDKNIFATTLQSLSV